MKKAEIEVELRGIKVCRRAPQISHMLFADDSMIFCKANIEENRVVQELLDTYENALGLKINKEKTSMVFSRMFQQKEGRGFCRCGGFKMLNRMKNIWAIQL